MAETKIVGSRLDSPLDLSGTSSLKLADGTVSAPGLSFSSDTNTGIYRIGADNFAFSTNGTKRLEISTTAVTSTVLVDSTGMRVTGNSTSATGAGLELLYQSGSAIIEAYDRSGAIFKPMIITADGMNIRNIGTDKIVISSTNVDIYGATTNNNAPTGAVGEYVESVVSTSTAVATSGTYFDMTSISLTAGDWDLTLRMYAANNGGTWTQVVFGIGTVSGNDSTGLTNPTTSAVQRWASSSTTPAELEFEMSNVRKSISSTTTFYAKANYAYTTGSPLYRVILSARRVR